MAKIHRVKWDKQGPAAISAASYGLEFEVREPEVVVDDSGVAVVGICGPLVQYGGFSCDGYDSILCRAEAAFSSSAKTVLLQINSPGGDVFGNLECARAIRAMADASGKGLIVYVDGQASSAAYALACAADRIVIPATGSVGSIGVVDTLLSMAKRNAAMGVDVAVITSGARKADGNPNVQISEAMLESRQAHVDELAGILHAWVSERRGLPVDTIKAFEAGSFTGASAVDAGLADDVLDFHELRGNLARGINSATARSVPEAKNLMASPKSSKYTDAMAALAALAEDGDEDAKKAMKKMLVSKEAAPPAKDAPPADDAPPTDDKKSSAPPAALAAVAAAAAPRASADADLDLRKELIELKNQVHAKNVAEKRSTLLATRPDLMKDEKTSAWLKAAPIETVESAVATLPVLTPAIAAVAAPTVGEGQPNASRLPADQSEALKRQMGLAAHPVASVGRVGFQTVFGATPDQLKAIEAGTIRQDGK